MLIDTWLSFIEKNRTRLNLLLFEDIVANGRLQLLRKDGGAMMHVDQGGFAGPLLEKMKELGMSALTDCFVLSRFIHGGPKFVRARRDDCFALENVLPRIPFEVYRQPFETFGVEFPVEYQQSRQVGEARPLGVVLYKEDFILTGIVVWTDGTVYSQAFIPDDPTETIQSMLVRASGRTWEGSLPTDDSELAVQEQAFRVAVNYNLLMVNKGFRQVGPTNPGHAARLQGYLAKAQKRKKGIDEARRDLNSVPLLYDFTQKVSLFRREQQSGDGSVSGRTLSPHWRAGHWRMQAHGQGMSLRKELFIEPVFVNEGKFGGKLSQTTVIVEE